MQHNIIAQGFSFKLRPVVDADAELIFCLRNHPMLKQYINNGPSSIENQLVWQSHYYQRQNDFYFVIEHKDTENFEGLVSIYNINNNKEAEWGRWILKPRSLAAVESAYLVYKTAFDTLGLESIYCRTMAANASVVSFHDSCQIEQRQILQQYNPQTKQMEDYVQHTMSKTNWLNVSFRLKQLAQSLAKRLIHA